MPKMKIWKNNQWVEVGGGGGDGRPATYVVAASNATAKSKAGADWVCDGVDDDIEIQAAINASRTQGRKVILTEGTFNITGFIMFFATKSTPLELQGMGMGVTILKRNAATLSRRNDPSNYYGPSNSLMLEFFDPIPNGFTNDGIAWTIKDLTLDGNKQTYSNLTGGSGLFETTEPGKFNFVRKFQNVEFRNNASYAVYLNEGLNISFESCYFTNNYDSSNAAPDVINSSSSYTSFTNCKFYRQDKSNMSGGVDCGDVDTFYFTNCSFHKYGKAIMGIPFGVITGCIFADVTTPIQTTNNNVVIGNNCTIAQFWY